VSSGTIIEQKNEVFKKHQVLLLAPICLDGLKQSGLLTKWANRQTGNPKSGQQLPESL
jgi:hypothetical protein